MLRSRSNETKESPDSLGGLHERQARTMSQRPYGSFQLSKQINSAKAAGRFDARRKRTRERRENLKLRIWKHLTVSISERDELVQDVRVYV